MSSSIDSMIVWRALQGFLGGGMVPTVFASAFLIFRGPWQKFIAPIIGLIATLGPTLGPTLGGYLTDAYSWRWLFFINVVPGIIVTVTTFVLIDIYQPDFSLLENFDWYGLISMAGFLGVLQYVLEGLLVASALIVPFLPRRKTPLQLAAFTGALLLGFELVLTHWFYAYLVWFFPFFVFALLAPSAERAPATAVEPHGRPVRELAQGDRIRGT